ncbi:hypothetical protein [Paenochrobactrum pullorum]|uniref:hypothetical protein n=1 Tax=Paenochrobactrum pullorum TaxID=1324351 RepID=UPI0035BC09FD
MSLHAEAYIGLNHLKYLAAVAIRLYKKKKLRRLSLFGAIHVQLLLLTNDVPEPIWPVMGRNGMPLWPDEACRLDGH